MKAMLNQSGWQSPFSTHLDGPRSYLASIRTLAVPEPLPYSAAM
jgi:hypothetical protein